MTAVEALRVETTRLERKIHTQFSIFCLRHGIDYWHSDPTKKSPLLESLCTARKLTDEFPFSFMKCIKAEFEKVAVGDAVGGS